MLSFLLTSLIRYNEKSPINKKIKDLYHFWGRNNNTRNKIFKGDETTRGRTGKWAKRLRGEGESGRNDPGAKRLGAKGKVGETTQGRTGKWAKRPGFSLHWHKNTCSPISNDEIAGTRPNMNIKVATYIMAYLHYSIVCILIVPLHYHKTVTCSTICNDEMAGSRPNIINTKWINSPICRENGKDYQRVFDTDSSALCPHL